MCGIWGYSIGPVGVSAAERAILAASLGKENDVRGGDSWGVYARNGKSHLMKGIGKVRQGFYFPMVHDCHVIMGHTRKATTGKVSYNNAHPFHIGPIIGAHNGFVHNHEEMNKAYNRDFEVDSMHIFAHIAEKRDISELQGWGAIEWTNQRSPDKVRLVKFSGGQLSCYGVCATEKDAAAKDASDHTVAIVWSSSEWHLTDSLELAGLRGRAFEFKIEPDRVYVVGNGLYRFDGDRRMSLGFRSWSSSNGGYCSGTNWGDCGEVYGEKWRERFDGRGHGPGSGAAATTAAAASSKKEGAPVIRAAKRVGRFAIVADNITSTFVDAGAVREFFENKEMMVVAPLRTDEPTIPPPLEEGKLASLAIVEGLAAEKARLESMAQVLEDHSNFGDGDEVS